MKSILKEIWMGFKNNASVGIDGTSYIKFKQNLDFELDIISRKIANKTFEFSYYKQKLLVKNINKTREISIPTIRDKIVLKWLFQNLQSNFTDTLEIPSIHSMLLDIKTSKNNFDCFIKLDIQNFFPSIDHEILLNKLALKLGDSYILELTKKAIMQSTVNINTPMSERIKYSNKTGVPQGLSISGLLSTIYLSGLTGKYNTLKDVKFYKYVDDMLIFCKKIEQKKIIKMLKSDFKELKLTIHGFDKDSKKSSLGTTKDKFEFLGYQFEGDRVGVRDISIQKIYKSINKIFLEFRQNKLTKKDFIFELNLKITGCIINNKKYGWLHYYSLINDLTILYSLDRFVEKNCNKFKIGYSNVKSFQKAYFEMKIPKSNYIFNNFLDMSNDEIWQVQAVLQNDSSWY